MDHLGHLALAHGQQLRHHADKIFGNVDHQEFHWLVDHAVDFTGDDGGLGDHHLIAFAAHGLDDDGRANSPRPVT